MIFCYSSTKWAKTVKWYQRNECCYKKYLKIWNHLWNWVVGRGWKSLEEQSRKRLMPWTKKCYGWFWWRLRRREELKRKMEHPTDYFSDYHQNADRNIDVKGHCDEILDDNEEYFIGHWSKGHPCYEVAKNLTELCPWPRAFRKVELKGNEQTYLGKNS